MSSLVETFLAMLLVLAIVLILVLPLIAGIADYEDEFGSYTPQTDLNNSMDNWENPESWPVPDDNYQGPVYE